MPTRASLEGEAAAEMEMPKGNNSPTTGPQHWKDEGKAAALHEECNSPNYNPKRQKQPQSQPCLQKEQFSVLFPHELHKQMQEERNGDHSKTQLSCFRFIFPQGIIVKISNPLCIKQSQSGFHFPISAISQKGDQNRISENQDGNRDLGSNLCSGREQQCSGACQPELWVAFNLAQ